jgi:hypothetical protein
MAGQEDECWRCGVQWASEDGPRTTLRMIRGGPQTQAEVLPDRPIVVAMTARARSADELRLEQARWTNEGGSFASEASAPLPATAAGR